ncbi:hypothetical protein F5Y07DRAFT_358355 [Xylaria sp. FL0933]|nr:hypothetical protein F5Y07DRAFT_358355 [Xylaria sp. FL0933]
MISTLIAESIKDSPALGLLQYTHQINSRRHKEMSITGCGKIGNRDDLEVPSPKRRRTDLESTAHLKDMIWRETICDALGLRDTISDEKLLRAIEDLRDTSRDTSVDTDLEIPEAGPHYKHLYRIHCSKARSDTYEDHPITKSTDGKDVHLSANLLITDFDLYVRRHPGISFVVIHEFLCCKRDALNPIEPMKEWGESLFIASKHLCSALSKIIMINTPPSKDVPAFEIGKESPHWSFWAFHNTSTLQKLHGLCDGIEKKHVSVFSEYFCISKQSAFESTRQLISSGYFTRQSLGYLFAPGSIVVFKSPQGDAYNTGYELVDWPSYEDRWVQSGNTSSTSDLLMTTYVTCNLSSWRFDGNFMKVPSKITFQAAIGTKKVPTESLSCVPFVCLTAEKQESLLRRGRMIWKCRKMHYISYSGWDFDRLEHFDNSRYMIDAALSKVFYRHTSQKEPKEQNKELEDHLGPEIMEQAEPPGVEFLLTAQAFVWGYNMWEKIWKKLAIDNCNEVDWDEKAFDNLVIDPDSKDVIQALVTNKIKNSMSTDLVRGKGSGLILLLHGPPGTGKTLTAESVAEHARKPLYRVTCGDIGTKPEAVEQYLKRVLILGKSWDCVVLLDEAEVFLQERSLEDIERNALVSVFLRSLEYYDGILILTSNRVGTFDEGFRSRIQLAIHYPKLEQPERRRVWDNFINRLDCDPIASEDIETRNLRSNLTELSKFDLNGREIRNAINVARPLAKSEGRKVDFESLKKVIRVQQKFYTYMKDMNEGLDDEKVARDEGKR